MKPELFDFRSDTVTRPTPEMRAAMAAAEVGDDVLDDDPSVHRLQERLAETLSKEASLFVPSGTMSNQIGVRVHCSPGDELICETGCHIYNYEQGGASQLSGVGTRTLTGRDSILRVDDLEGLVRPIDDHCVQTRLLCLENTHNRGGGRVLPLEAVESTCRWAHENSLATHLDGARLFNAVVATGIAPQEWARHFDTVSICFSKGLGAPVGSALAGPRDLIRKARRHRKLFGGGMRQAGVLAAAALHALEHHVERLADDHARARRLADAIRATPGLALSPAEVDTNIVIFAVDRSLGSPGEFSARLQAHGVLINAIGSDRLRAVTHLDVDDRAVDRAIEAIAEASHSARRGQPAPAPVLSPYA